MRILIDTNILISGLFYGGLPERLLFELGEDFKICVNEEIMSEYHAQIRKKVLQSKKILNEKLSEKFFKSLQSFEMKSNLKVSRDAKAIYIVSGDNDLLTIKNFEGIEIVTAREFYDKYLK